MMPKKPVLWFMIYAAVIFVVNYLLAGNDREVVPALLVAMISGVIVLFLAFLIDKVRSSNS